MSFSLNPVVVTSSARNYPIAVQSGLIGSLDQILDDSLPRFHAVVITDENVAKHWLQPVLASLEQVFAQVHSVTCPAGEESKSVEMAFRLWEQLMEFSADRKTVVVALGGGVVGDLAGFAAATFMRGLPLVQIPTTLLAQVDSSVGGKTGINLPAAKNMVGAFLAPHQVIVDPDVLSTLAEREFVSGLAEVVKYGMILDADFFESLEKNSEVILRREPATLAVVIRKCCELKSGVVTQDEFESMGLRAKLNYGHTFGHAIEAVAGYGQRLHGEAVSIGMTCAARLALILGKIDEQVVDRQSLLLSKFGLPLKLDGENVTGLMQAMKHDKKKSGGFPRLVLPNATGSVELVDWPGDKLIEQVWLESGASA